MDTLVVELVAAARLPPKGSISGSLYALRARVRSEPNLEFIGNGFRPRLQTSHTLIQIMVDSGLSEPLLSEEKKCDHLEYEEAASDPSDQAPPLDQNCCENENDRGNADCDDDDNDDEPSQHHAFTVWSEIGEMTSLAVPLAISFFCRMAMASTDSAFVGHINDARHSAETYLAAAVLSDIVVNVLMVPPLAFNQVLNALVGQAMGSGNPKMAGIWLQQSMFWLSLTMLPCLVGCFYAEPILLLLDFPAEVAHVAGTYAKFNVIWPIPNGLYQCMRFYFQAQGLPRPAMYNNMAFMFVNAGLNWLFVFGGPFRHLPVGFPGRWHGFGFIGAAVSLSISRTAQSVTYFLYMFVYRKHHLRTWPGLSLGHHNRSRTMEFLRQSVPNMGTLLFQQCASQATTVLVGRLGELAIATSSALSTVTLPWSGTLSATCWTVSSVRIGYHLGRGDGTAARKSAWIVLYFITLINVVMSAVFIPLKGDVLNIATNDDDVISLGSVIIPALLVGTYLNAVVGNITSGVFSGMGRPVIATILSFGLELPLSIGGVALLILKFKTNLLGVYWFQAISGGVEGLLVLGIVLWSNWDKCADEARVRQELSPASGSRAESEETADLLDVIEDQREDEGIFVDEHNSS